MELMVSKHQILMCEQDKSLTRECGSFYTLRRVGIVVIYANCLKMTVCIDIGRISKV